MAAPVITSISPASAAIGDTLTVIGTGFGASQGASTIFYRDIPVIPLSWGDTSITFKIPVGAAVLKYANTTAPTDNDVVIIIGATFAKLKHIATK
jgi:hypothetical protein